MQVDGVALQKAVQEAGFKRLDLGISSPNSGLLTQSDDLVMPVYLRWARSQSRFQAEYASLTYITQQSTEMARFVPQIIAAFPSLHNGLLLVPYKSGPCLSDFIPSEANVPPFSASHTSALHSQSYAPKKVDSALQALGRAIRLLHTISLDHFGKLTGTEPNPYTSQARDFTYQEAQHALQQCLERGWFNASYGQKIRSWLYERWVLIALNEKPCLIHYDLHPGNVRLKLSEKDEWEFDGIFDFELARGWLPEYDLAALAWYLKEMSETSWQAFLDGYGSINTGRLLLFDMLKI